MSDLTVYVDFCFAPMNSLAGNVQENTAFIWFTPKKYSSVRFRESDLTDLLMNCSRPNRRSSMKDSSKRPSSPRNGNCLLKALPGRDGTTIWRCQGKIRNKNHKKYDNKIRNSSSTSAVVSSLNSVDFALLYLHSNQVMNLIWMAVQKHGDSYKEDTKKYAFSFAISTQRTKLGV